MIARSFGTEDMPAVKLVSGQSILKARPPATVSREVQCLLKMGEPRRDRRRAGAAARRDGGGTIERARRAPRDVRRDDHLLVAAELRRGGRDARGEDDGLVEGQSVGQELEDDVAHHQPLPCLARIIGGRDAADDDLLFARERAGRDAQLERGALHVGDVDAIARHPDESPHQRLFFPRFLLGRLFDSAVGARCRHAGGDEHHEEEESTREGERSRWVHGSNLTRPNRGHKRGPVSELSST